MSEMTLNIVGAKSLVALRCLVSFLFYVLFYEQGGNGDAKNKISKCCIYFNDGVLYGLLYDMLHRSKKKCGLNMWLYLFRFSL